MARRTIALKPRQGTTLAHGSNAQSPLPGEDGQAVPASLDPRRNAQATGAGFLSLRGTGKGLWEAPAQMTQDEREEWS
jgi:hypothetical protein